jgi:hypothetical protein
VKSAYEIVLDAATSAAIDALRHVRSGKIQSLSGVEEYIGGRLNGILDFILPAAKEEVSSLLAPATQQAVDAIKPAMYDVLRDWTPSIAAIVGGMAGLSILLGVWVSKKTYTRTRRNPSRRCA